LLSLSPGRRAPRIILGAVAVGAAVGLVVAGFEQLTENILLDYLFSLPLWQQSLAPLVGLALSALILRWVGGKSTTTATSDEYVRAFHERTPRLPLRQLPAKLLAGASTIGLGGSVGLEGPSIYAGASVALNGPASIARRWFTREETRVLLSAGAAAGVAAIFKAPATGVMFALEAPYRDDVNRRALLPSLIASAVSFVVFAAVHGANPVFPSLGQERLELSLADLLGGALLGVAAGFGGRGFSWFTRQAKSLQARFRWVWRFLLCAAVLCGLVWLTYELFDEPLSLGPGGEAVDWVLTPEHSLWLIVALFTIRAAATLTTIVGGGTGGLFIPLAVQGIIMGAFIGELLNSSATSLYPTLGLAAFLGAGYRAPIAAVMFVAESTRGSPFVVPALVAAAVSQLVAGRSSVTSYQVGERQGHLERRLALPVSAALTTDTLSVPPDATVSEFVFFHALRRRVRDVPVVDGNRYLGMCSLDQVNEIDRDQWETILTSEVLAPGYPTMPLTATLRDAVSAMEEADVDVLPVLDSQGNFAGVVTNDDIVRLEEIMKETGG